jgi:hypothetical protein
MFNSFLNTYLRIFYSSFPPKKINIKISSDAWITQGIRNSCKHKRDIYVLRTNSSDKILKTHYKAHGKTLSNVIKEAKNYHYNRQIENSSNKINLSPSHLISICYQQPNQIIRLLITVLKIP